MRRQRWAISVIALICAAFASPGAEAQDDDDASRSALRQLQAEQFEALFEDPDNLDLMFTYALTSIRLKDYEAAISTFDRMLIFNPNQPRVEVELAAAYFRIGSYPVAKFYFQSALENESTPDALKPRINEFLAAIDQRTQKSYFTGSVGLSAVGTTNANNGPNGREVEFFGIVTELSGDDVTGQTDIGAAISAQVTHFYDLGQTDGDRWRTDGALYGVRYSSTEDGATDVIVLRTGPEISLDEDRNGPKARPFIEFDHVRSSNDALFTSIGAGLELTNTVSPRVSVFGDLRASWRDYHERGPELDGVLIRSDAGLTYFADDQTTFRGGIRAEYEGTDDADDRSLLVGLKGAGFFRYDSGFDFASRNWLVTADAQVSYTG
ncbi:MAG: hypothetical protein AAF360_03030, partial [Pseudomonadota bacterium]